MIGSTLASSAIAATTAALLSGCSHLVVLHDALDPSEHNDLGVVYEHEGKYDLAAREYRRALRSDPRFTRARINLGNLAARAEHWPEAEKLYRRALADGPSDGDALNNLAIVLVRQRRRLDEAEALASRAVTIGGRDSIYRATLAEVRAARRGP
jgi:tetratricopeptide (TPR) repeat protein